MVELAETLRDVCVARLVPTQPWSVHVTQPISDAIELMRKKKVGCILICVERRVAGIFTERDVVRRVLARGVDLHRPISEVMTPDPCCVRPNDPISLAIKIMKTGGYRHLPVVVDGRPMGILSVKRIVHYLVGMFAPDVYSRSPKSSPFRYAACKSRREGA